MLTVPAKINPVVRKATVFMPKSSSVGVYESASNGIGASMPFGGGR